MQQHLRICARCCKYLLDRQILYGRCHITVVHQLQHRWLGLTWTDTTHKRYCNEEHQYWFPAVCSGMIRHLSAIQICGLMIAAHGCWVCLCSTSGCPYGEGCHFLHYVPGGVAALGMMPLAAPVATGALTPTGGVRKVLGGFGPSSMQASSPGSVADPSTTVGGFKTRLCNRFNTPEGCRFGDRCHFAHGESDLRPSNGRSSSRNGLDYSVLVLDHPPHVFVLPWPSFGATGGSLHCYLLGSPLVEVRDTGINFAACNGGGMSFR